MVRNTQTRKSTAENYLSIWRHFNRFLIELNGKIDSWEERTAIFGAYLIDSGVQSSTLKSYFSAIKFTLKMDGYKWDNDKAKLSCLARGCKIINDKLKIRLPIRKNLLEMILKQVRQMFAIHLF